MASQLHQAVELAQAGRRDEARQLFLSYLQSNPDHEVAWLWLASVAVTQAEYQHALNQVLRINPANERAQRLLDEFQRQQYGAPYAAPVAPPASSPRTPPPVAPPVYGTPLPYAGEPPSQPRWEPPAEESRYAAPPPVYGAPAPYAEPVRAKPVEVEVREVRRRGCFPGIGCMPGCLGCTGCGLPSCLLALLVLVVIPLAVLAAISYSGSSLGPIDLLAAYLPDSFGRKELTFSADTNDITLKVPRSWLLASDQNEQWTAMRSVLETLIPFRDDTRQWQDFETVPNQQVILEASPIALAQFGDVITLAYQGTTQGAFDCTAVRQLADVEKTYPHGNLCSFRRSTTQPGPADEVFRTVDPPATERLITFVVPTSSTSATQWELRLPEEAYAQFADDIDVLIESVDVTSATR